MAHIVFLQLQRFQYPGLYYICGALRDAGHRYQVLAVNSLEAAAALALPEAPDLFGFPTMTGMHRDVLSAASMLKSRYPQSRTILGGIHPTLYPDIIANDAVDFICRGEGEQALVELMNAIDDGTAIGEIANLSVKQGDRIRHHPMRPLTTPLDALPFPDYGIYREDPLIAADTYPMVFMTRGCPFSCTYCHNSRQKVIYRGLGPYVRTFSIDRILDEVSSALEYYPATRAVWLGSDTLGSRYDFLEDLLVRYQRRFNLPYTCMIRPEFINRRLVRLLSRTGCHMLAFGIESGSERIRRDLLRRHYSNRKIREAATLLKKHHIRFRSYNIIGFPSETRYEMLQTLTLNQEVGPSFPWVSIFTPYPETDLAAYAYAHGYLDPSFNFDHVPTSFFNDTILKNVDRDYILNLHSFFLLLVMAPRLTPLLMKLVRGPHLKLYRLVFKAAYSVQSMRSEKRSPLVFFRMAMANRRLFK